MRSLSCIRHRSAFYWIWVLLVVIAAASERNDGEEHEHDVKVLRTLTQKQDMRRQLRRPKPAKKLDYPYILRKSSKKKKSKSSKSSKKGKGYSDSSSSSSSSKISSSKRCGGKGRNGSSLRCKGKGSTSILDHSPTAVPSISASLAPFSTPSVASVQPSSMPSLSPSRTASLAPSITPSVVSSSGPSSSPTTQPSPMPSLSPSRNSDSFPSQLPSSFPTIEFDLQTCESYSRRWLIDLSRTCDSLFRNCECIDAQRLIDNGQIDCSVDVCPSGCTICNFCLEDVISCIPPGATVRSAVSPISQTKTLPTPGEEVVVLNMEKSFDLGNCVSYEEQWLNDLNSSCHTQGGKRRDCTCDDAQRRMEKGQIDCDNFSCPDDCEVCKFCLVNILGCHDGHVE